MASKDSTVGGKEDVDKEKGGKESTTAKPSKDKEVVDGEKEQTVHSIYGVDRPCILSTCPSG